MFKSALIICVLLAMTNAMANDLSAVDLAIRIMSNDGSFTVSSIQNSSPTEAFVKTGLEVENSTQDLIIQAMSMSEDSKEIF